jgi:hypothetical protein
MMLGPTDWTAHDQHAGFFRSPVPSGTSGYAFRMAVAGIDQEPNLNDPVLGVGVDIKS